MATASPWSAVVVGDGRFDTAGVYAPDGTRTAAGHILAVPETHQIAVVVPVLALGRHRPRDGSLRHCDVRQRRGRRGHRLHPAGVRPGVLAEPAARTSGGSSSTASAAARAYGTTRPSKDTDTRDPNAIDMIVGPGQSQADVMNWQVSNPVALPMVPLVP